MSYDLVLCPMALSNVPWPCPMSHGAVLCPMARASAPLPKPAHAQDLPMPLAAANETLREELQRSMAGLPLLPLPQAHQQRDGRSSPALAWLCHVILNWPFAKAKDSQDHRT